CRFQELTKTSSPLSTVPLSGSPGGASICGGPYQPVCWLVADPAPQLRRPSHLGSLVARLIAREPVPWRIPLSTKADMPLRPFSRVLSATALVLLASGAACKNDSGVTGPPTLEGQYKGRLAGEYAPTFSASLDLTVAASTTGTITPGGAARITVSA